MENSGNWLDLFRLMVRVRHFEQSAFELYTAGKLPGFLHLSIGQEATSVGACAALRPDDYMASTHRGHGDTIAKGVSVEAAMTELFGGATFAGDAIERHADIHLALAVALGENESEGLITPVITRCQDRSLIEIAAGAKAAIERARAGRLNTDDLDGGTFTVSNLGMFGVKDFAAIVNPPHAAILAVGAVRRVPVFDAQDRVIPAQLLTATLSADHRISDGAEAARFLGALKGHLEDAFSLVSAF